jgi:hypothetical protein
MAFDKTLPSNSTKIRNYPTVLTDNFSAIQQGDDTLQYWQTNYIDRDNVAGAPPPTQDPTRNDDTIIVFSKTDTASELYVMDAVSPTANIIQLTEDGRLGSDSTNISLNRFTFDKGTTNYDKQNIVNAYGNVISGSLVGGFGCSVASGGTGNIDVTFSTARASGNYVVVATVVSSGGSRRYIGINNKVAGSFRITTLNSSGSAQNNDVSFMVIGGLA